MRLQTRFALIAGAITTLASLAIGYFAITTAFNSEITRVDELIGRVTTQLDSRDPLSSAVFLADESDSELLVALLDSSGELITVRTSAEGEILELPAVQVKNRTGSIETLGVKERYRVETLDKY